MAAAEAADPSLHARMAGQVEVVTAELRRRIGKSFTLAELAGVYEHSDRWSREAVAEQSSGALWARSLTMATDAAFHLYSRGARDYRP